jgi:hypothetical protein
MNTIKCTHCGKEIELSEALTKDIEKTVLEAEHKKHQEEIDAIRKESEEKTAKIIEAEKIKAQELASAKIETKLKHLQEQSDADKEEVKQLRDQLTELMKDLREARKASANAELDMQKKLAEEEQKIREDAQKEAGENQRLKLAEKDKQLEAAKRQVEEMQRKLNQGSQQLQGEILELDLEEALSNEFRDDLISPVDKGVKGADIKQTVRTSRGTECGVILWETKRTKNWTEGWVLKLKDDLRATKANIPVIISEVLPLPNTAGIAFHNGIYVAKPTYAIILAGLLRKNLIDVGREKAIAQHRDTSADALYSFVTSHEFVQQIEAMVEVYQSQLGQINKERVAYEKFWSEREKQSQKLLLSTANIIGSMQGQIGSGSMPKIKGLEIDLLGSGEEE